MFLKQESHWATVQNEVANEITDKAPSMTRLGYILSIRQCLKKGYVHGLGAECSNAVYGKWPQCLLIHRPASAAV